MCACKQRPLLEITTVEADEKNIVGLCQDGEWGDDVCRQHDLRDRPFAARTPNPVEMQRKLPFAGTTILSAGRVESESAVPP
jgi:hypothetical protein